MDYTGSVQTMGDDAMLALPMDKSVRLAALVIIKIQNDHRAANLA
jgi:hypothetical protein